MDLPSRFALATPLNVMLTVVHFVAALVLTWSFVMLYRWIARRSAVLARLFAAGLILRAIAGVMLFFISFFGWPFFRNLQVGEGFWALAVDGRTYYEIAEHAAMHRLDSISGSFPSPMFMRTLAVWMRIFGVGPASALLLNVSTYAACALLMVIAAGTRERSELREIAGPAVALAALSFSPALLLFSTQPLKDPLCALLLIGVICGVRVRWTAVNERSGGRAAGVVAGTGLIAAGIYGLAGIRAYVCVFVMAVLVATAVYSLVMQPSWQRRILGALHDFVLVALLWVVFLAGAGPYAAFYQSAISSVFGAPAAAPLKAFDTARTGFSATAGATSVATREEGAPSAGIAEGADQQSNIVSPARPRPRTIIGRIGWLIRGLAVFFIPISALTAASIVSFSGGRGLLLITDLDTIAIDLTIVLSLALLLLSLRRDRLTSAMIFSLVLGVLLTTSMAYVVTNYGALFRLRLMGLIPLWMMLVLLPRRPRDGADGVRIT